MKPMTLVCSSAHELEWMLPASVSQIVTSPPYFGLRAYAGEQSIPWPAVHYAPMPNLPAITVPAWDGAMGHEPTLEMYIGHLILCLRAWASVLHPTGTAWINLGDSYAQDSKWGGKSGEKNYTSDAGGFQRGRRRTGLADKNLCMVPERFRLAAQADGWIVRAKMPWIRSNAMPESVSDRPGFSHEDWVMLAKSSRYYYDAEAVKLPDGGKASGNGFHRPERLSINGDGQDERWTPGRGRNRRTSDWTFESIEWAAHARHVLDSGGILVNTDGSPLALNVPTRGFKDAHFAVYPPALIEPIIQAGTSEKGICPDCGTPWERTILKTGKSLSVEERRGRTGHTGQPPQISGNYWNGPTTTATEHFRPGCTCGAPDGMQPDDMDIINTPTGSDSDDPTLYVGRAGMARPRTEDGGQRPISRYEQRRIAEQIRNSPHYAEMEAEAGSAIEHYRRLDAAGGRPVPQPLLDKWIARGWIEPVPLPRWNPPQPIPAVVFDPFHGSGTTGGVALRLGRHYVGADISPDYLGELTQKRIDSIAAT